MKNRYSLLLIGLLLSPLCAMKRNAPDFPEKLDPGTRMATNFSGEESETESTEIEDNFSGTEDIENKNDIPTKPSIDVIKSSLQSNGMDLEESENESSFSDIENIEDSTNPSINSIRDSLRSNSMAHTSPSTATITASLASNMIASDTQKKQKLACKYCNKLFMYQGYLNKHLQNIHHASLTYSCTHCDYVASKENEWLKHSWEAHGNNKPYECKVPSCKYKAKEKQGLKNHMAYTHKSK